MKTAAAITSVLILVCAGAFAQEKKAPPPAEAPKPAAGDVEYRPPTRGAPKVRVGGSTRGLQRALSLAVIAPDHAGLASKEQPDLYWYVSRPVESPLELAIFPVDSDEPLVETKIAPVSQAGIQRIRVADLKVKLKPGEEYQWIISFATKPGSRAKDAIASGRVRVQPVPAMKTYGEYAKAGYWYDAFAGLREEMARHPNDARLAAAEQSLLEQVGLGEVARSERERLTAKIDSGEPKAVNRKP